MNELQNRPIELLFEELENITLPTTEVNELVTDLKNIVMDQLTWTCPFCETMFLEEQIKLEAEAKNKGFNSHEERCDEYEMMCDV